MLNTQGLPMLENFSNSPSSLLQKASASTPGHPCWLEQHPGLKRPIPLLGRILTISTRNREPELCKCSSFNSHSQQISHTNVDKKLPEKTKSSAIDSNKKIQGPKSFLSRSRKQTIFWKTKENQWTLPKKESLTSECSCTPRRRTLPPRGPRGLLTHSSAKGLSKASRHSHLVSGKVSLKSSTHATLHLCGKKYYPRPFQEYHYILDINKTNSYRHNGSHHKVSMFSFSIWNQHSTFIPKKIKSPQVNLWKQPTLLHEGLIYNFHYSHTMDTPSTCY